MTAEPLTVSVADAATMLGVSGDLVYDLIAGGDLPAVKLGSRRLVPVRAIEVILDRALVGFDPDRVLARLAGAAHSSADGPGEPTAGEWTGTTGPEARVTDTRQVPAGPGLPRLRPLRNPKGSAAHS